MAHYPGGASPYPGGYDPASLEWSVSVTDDDQRTMTAAQIVEEYQRGTLDLQDTFVWREGMGDWVPLGQAPELAQLLGQPSAAAAGYAAGPSDAPGGLGSTVMMDSPVDAAPAPAPVPEPGLAPAARLGGAPSVDVFESQGGDSSGGHGPRRGPPRRVGERNEASALFSLDQITGGKPKPEKKSGAGGDDFMAFGSGFASGGIAASAFEPPPLNAPVLTPPPQPKLPPQVEAQLLAAAQLEPPKKSKTGVIVAAAVVGVLLFGVITLVLLMRKPDEQPTALNTDGDTSTSASETPAGPDDGSTSKDDTATSTDTASPDATADSTAEPDSSSDSKTGSSRSGSSSSSSKGSKTDSKDSSSKTDSKDSSSKTDATDSGKTDTKTPEPAGAEFNRDAASAAMGSAAGSASGCGKPGGPTGRGRVSVTFAPSGRATNVSVGPPFGGTSVGSCIASAFKRVSVPPFSGGAITVSKSVSVK